MNTSLNRFVMTAALGFFLIGGFGLSATAAEPEIGIREGKMFSPPPPKPLNKKGLKFSTELVKRDCGEGEKNPGHDVFAVATKAKDGSVKWRTMLWTWVHPCTQKTIDGKPVALGHVGILPVSMKLVKNTLHVMSNRDQDFEISIKDGKLREAPAPVMGTEGP